MTRYSSFDDTNEIRQRYVYKNTNRDISILKLLILRYRTWLTNLMHLQLLQGDFIAEFVDSQNLRFY